MASRIKGGATLDTDLAEALGIARPRNIRPNLIEPNLDELRTYGNLLATKANPGKPGRPSYQYHLNEDQALLLCTFSRTEKAAEVRKEVIETFRAYINLLAVRAISAEAGNTPYLTAKCVEAQSYPFIRREHATTSAPLRFTAAYRDIASVAAVEQLPTHTEKPPVHLAIVTRPQQRYPLIQRRRAVPIPRTS